MKSPFFNGAWHEAWDIEHWTTDVGTTSHAWCSGPTALLPQKVLGVEPVAAGWQTFSVRPNPCDLKWANGVVASPFGAICVEWKINPQGNFQLYVKVPEHTNAVIAVPGNDPKKIRINGKEFIRIPEYNQTGAENGRVEFKVPSGAYQIVVSN